MTSGPPLGTRLGRESPLRCGLWGIARYCVPLRWTLRRCEAVVEADLPSEALDDRPVRRPEPTLPVTDRLHDLAAVDDEGGVWPAGGIPQGEDRGVRACALAVETAAAEEPLEVAVRVRGDEVPLAPYIVCTYTDRSHRRTIELRLANTSGTGWRCVARDSLDAPVVEYAESWGRRTVSS